MKKKSGTMLAYIIALFTVMLLVQTSGYTAVCTGKYYATAACSTYNAWPNTCNDHTQLVADKKGNKYYDCYWNETGKKCDSTGAVCDWPHVTHKK